MLYLSQRLHSDSQTITWPSQKRSKNILDKKIRKGILRAKEEVHKITSVSSTRSRQKNEDRSRYVRLYYRESFIYRM